MTRAYGHLKRGVFFKLGSFRNFVPVNVEVLYSLFFAISFSFDFSVNIKKLGVIFYLLLFYRIHLGCIC